MGVIKRHDAPIWYIIVEHDGRRYKASSNTTDKTKARAIEAKMRTEPDSATYACTISDTPSLHDW